MKIRELREITVYYCDICGNECGLPYTGYDEVGYGSCCERLMRVLNQNDMMDEISSKITTFKNFWDRYAQVKELKRISKST